MNRRSLFQKIFGGGPKVAPGNHKPYELISDTKNTFYAWDGQIIQSDIVRSCIRPKANAIGKLAGKHIRGYDEDMRINPNPYIRELLQNPNPYMSMQDFLVKMTWQRELYHNAFAYIQRDENKLPIALYPVPYAEVKLQSVGGEPFVRFRLWTGKIVEVDYQDVIHLRKDFSNNDFFGEPGSAPLKPLMEVINTTDQGVVAAIKNSAIIRWILKFKSVLQPEDRKARVDEFVTNYLSITNEGGAAAADPRYDVEQVRQDSFVPSNGLMKSTVDRLYAYFGVNNEIVHNKYSEDDWNSFYESEIEPVLIELSNSFSRCFFTRKERGFGNRIVFEASNLAYSSMRTKLSLVSMVDRGAMSPNEWRKIMNLPPIEGGSEPIRRLDTVPVGEEEKELTKEGVDDPDDHNG